MNMASYPRRSSQRVLVMRTKDVTLNKIQKRKDKRMITERRGKNEEMLWWRVDKNRERGNKKKGYNNKGAKEKAVEKRNWVAK